MSEETRIGDDQQEGEESGVVSPESPEANAVPESLNLDTDEEAQPASLAGEASSENGSESEPVAEAEAEESSEAETAEPVAEATGEAEAEESPEAEIAEPVAEAVVEESAEAETAEPVAEATSEAETAEPVAEESPEAEIAEPVAEAVAEESAEAETAEPVAEENSEAETAEPVAEAVAEESAEAETAEPVAEETSEAQDAESDEDKKVVLLSVGQELEGEVKRTTDFGAFVDIGAGRDGLVHISELSVGRVNAVTEVVKSGDKIKVWIKKLDRKRNRISLTMISPDTKTIRDINEGDVIEGTVTRIVPYGAFIDIGIGNDGLLHIREMSSGYVEKPEDVVKVGDTFDVRITTVNRRRRRVDLSIKGLPAEPESAVEESMEEAQIEAEAEIEDAFEDVEVLSPMELAFKKAMEAEGVELDESTPARRRKGRRGKRATRALQDEIIQRTLETMKD